MDALKTLILLIAIIVTGSVIGGAIKTYQALYEIYGDCRDM